MIPSGTELARPFLPAKDFDVSKAFYETVGFEKLLDADVAAIRVGAKKHSNQCEVEGMCNQAQPCLVEALAWRTDEIFTIRRTNRKRVWGVLEGPDPLLLWWDPMHAVYPTEPKILDTREG